MAVRRLAAEQPESFEFTEKNLVWAKKLIDRYPAGRQASAVIPLLWRAQEQHDGWVCEPAIRYIAEMLDMPKIRVLEVATFYTMFQLQPVGKKAHIQVCGTTPCQLRGSEELVKICQSRIAKHMHEISEDGMFSWEEVECLGACVNAPMVQIFKDTYEDLTPDTFNKLLDDISAGKEVTPGPQNGRRFGMAEGGQTTLSEVEDDTVGLLPVPHLVDGNEKASHDFAGGPINADGNDYDGVPTPAEDAVAKVKAAFAAKSDKAAEKPAAKPAAPKAAPKPAAVAKTEPAAGEKEPELLKAARGGKADDLKQLKGVGPKLEGTLNELGVYHFDQVASWGADEIAWVDARLKFKGRIERDGWIEQAKILADGGTTEFSKRVAAGEVASSKSEE
ncbi:MAG: NADH-quinone oxidoreductase subunit NuoE [Rhodobacteraceae bacterium]|nr:NADH-quinone oxidoreductase subunit NuoE [Paracoccaceae bacterium]